jgi:hypothetical protein
VSELPGRCRVNSANLWWRSHRLGVSLREKRNDARSHPIGEGVGRVYLFVICPPH